MAGYGKIPAGATLKPNPFNINVDENKLQDMKQLLKLSPIGPAVYENTAKDQGETKLSRPDRVFGMRRDWLSNAKDHWLDGFDWRKREERLNSFPHFKVEVTGSDGVAIDVHFMALFSEKPDAIPIAFYHGWPGSFLEFTKILELLRSKYSPKDLPYHVIVPSLPGYAFSSGPPLDQDYSIEQAAQLLHTLMCGLGFEKGYLAQGGDVGSGICFIQAARFDECKSMHVNMCMIDPELVKAATEMDEVEAKAVPRAGAFMTNGMAYAMEHGTRPATIGLALSASPLAMLSWIGEKFLEWSDEDPALDDILESISLYWLTDTCMQILWHKTHWVRQLLTISIKSISPEVHLPLSGFSVRGKTATSSHRQTGWLFILP